MKILHTADWHIGNFPGPVDNGVNLRGKDIYDCLNFMTSIAEERQVDIIVMSGDLFHQAKVWVDRGLDEITQAINIIKKLSLIAPVCILRGTPNHDGGEQFKMLEKIFKEDPNITIFNSPTTKIISTKSGKINIAGLPGFERGSFRSQFSGLSKKEENEKITKKLGEIIISLKSDCNPDFKSVLITHYTTYGSNTESGQTCFSQLEPLLFPKTLEKANFDLTALGHIHKPQRVPNCPNTYYSGAINALNFNDEGQDRGFWIHNLEDNTHEFIKTPYRQFLTIKMDNDEITCFNAEKKLSIEQKNISGKIIRVRYKATDEQDKIFNKAIIEKILYDKGAFWVQEIVPENILTTTKSNFSEKNSPESNLIEYLQKKQEPNIDEIVKEAQSIIEEAEQNNIVTNIIGPLIPVNIEIENYRNFKKENIDFKDIVFCLINGKNGSGKSSIIDAIHDCLYEETREKDIMGWINNKERTGKMIFTFKIGEKTFRVARTRTKSKNGKTSTATLNLSELVNDEWINKSKEKLIDTQKEIINIIGMDSFTFKTCVLIMQDQYGLFLESSKEDRMKTLGNILGLEIYEVLEKITKEKARELNRKIKNSSEQVKKLTSELLNEKEIKKEIKLSEENIKNKQSKIQELINENNILKMNLKTITETVERIEKIKEEIEKNKAKIENIKANMKIQDEILEKSNNILLQEKNIVEKVNRYNVLLEQEKKLISSKTLYDSKKQKYEEITKEIEDIKKEYQETINEKEKLTKKIKPLKDRVDKEEELKKRHNQYIIEKKSIVDMETKTRKYIEIKNKILDTKENYLKNKNKFDFEYNKRISKFNNLKEKTQLLKDSNCIDLAKAQCKFLIDAKKAAKEMVEYQKASKIWKEKEEKILKEEKIKIAELIKQGEKLKYDPDAISKKRQIVEKLEKYSKEYEALNNYKEQIRFINENIEASNKKIIILEKEIKNKRNKREELKKEILNISTKVDKYNSIISEIEKTKEWIKKEKELPVAKERKRVAETRLIELKREKEEIKKEINKKEEELKTEEKKTEGLSKTKINTLFETFISNNEKSISEIQTYIQKMSMNIGKYKQQLENNKKIQTEISKLTAFIKDVASKISVYEKLKTAFSQDGIPHNIIRSIIPILEATSNNVLGQMSGGKMSVELVTEKTLRSNNKKEVTTLDIFIIDDGKLPYKSKSGGEKVKVSLAIALALAEIKSSRAGIQLGMLFIDEPPFLDEEGVQAYCDALETIQYRYPHLKILAITHDPEMKSRFPQCIEVENTEEGSKITQFNM
jgi:exonuclease SbcD